jgi:hypothetical protein
LDLIELRERRTFRREILHRKKQGKGSVDYTHNSGSTFINDTEDKNVIASERRERGNLIKKKYSLIFLWDCHAALSMT